MSNGMISYRYAHAFLDYVHSRGTEETVYAQVRVILRVMGRSRELCEDISDCRTVKHDDKVKLLETVIFPDKLAPEIDNLLSLLERNGRAEHMRMILLDFLNYYREEKGILAVNIVTAAEDDKLVPLVEQIVKEEGGQQALIRYRVDPDIIGGFLVESWGYRYDATVRTALEQMRKKLTNKNKRIV